MGLKKSLSSAGVLAFLAALATESMLGGCSSDKHWRRHHYSYTYPSENQGNINYYPDQMQGYIPGYMPARRPVISDEEYYWNNKILHGQGVVPNYPVRPPISDEAYRAMQPRLQGQGVVPNYPVRPPISDEEYRASQEKPMLGGQGVIYPTR